MNIKFRELHYSHDWPWVRKYLPLQRCEGGTGVAAYDAETGILQAAMITESWTATSVVTHMIIANKMVLRHGFFEECAWYVFTHADRCKMYGHIRSDNEAAIKLDTHIGFTEVVRLKDAYDIGVDDVVMELHRDDCRYWGGPAEDRRVANG
jgi:hypothetical protein